MTLKGRWFVHRSESGQQHGIKWKEQSTDGKLHTNTFIFSDLAAAETPPQQKHWSL